MNMDKIAQLAVDECIRQHVGLDRVGMLLDAYDKARSLRTTAHMRYPTLDVIMALAGTLEPSNGGRLRSTPVTFANGGSSASPGDVQRLAERLFDCVVEMDTDPEWFTREFLWIHPLADGNGRVSWILWNWLNDTLDNPTPLPDFGW